LKIEFQNTIVESDSVFIQILDNTIRKQEDGKKEKKKFVHYL